jgi:NAD(P)-dependent dehydrogenase (short-subunit alcohol dehydrogenase family)
MSRSIAVEFARFNVRSNAIVPGLVDTDMSSRAIRADRFADRMMPRIPLRRWGASSDFGAIAVYLASPSSSYHTGDTLTLDGGFHVS